MLETSARRAISALAAVALTLLGTGCSSDESAAPKASPTPLASLNTSSMQIPRIEFCKLLPDSAVQDALGAKPDSSASYRPGDSVDLPGVGKEVVHEIGCLWRTSAGATARAWIFARPVDAAFARDTIASGKETKGCTVTPGPAYGEPSTTQTCRLPDGSTRVRHAGLFGQTWLTCEVGDPGTEKNSAGKHAVRQRADRWCVEVVNALNTSG
jgi:hypothetical protein